MATLTLWVWCKVKMGTLTGEAPVLPAPPTNPRPTPCCHDVTGLQGWQGRKQRKSSSSRRRSIAERRLTTKDTSPRRRRASSSYDKGDVGGAARRGGPSPACHRASFPNAMLTWMSCEFIYLFGCGGHSVSLSVKHLKGEKDASAHVIT